MRIRCAKCNKPVDRWEMWDEENPPKKVIRAFCHGDIDTMFMTLLDLSKLTRDDIQQLENQEGLAFQTDRIA